MIDVQMNSEAVFGEFQLRILVTNAKDINVLVGIWRDSMFSCNRK
jgi:hypothetical protein